MPMPAVKKELINSIGEQMNDVAYIRSVELALWEENPNLAQICNHSMDTINQIITDNEAHRSAAQTVGRTVYLLLYSAIKQQMICDELE